VLLNGPSLAVNCLQNKTKIVEFPRNQSVLHMENLCESFHVLQMVTGHHIKKFRIGKWIRFRKCWIPREVKRPAGFHLDQGRSLGLVLPTAKKELKIGSRCLYMRHFNY
jgi:hypothetical protein